MFLLAHDFRRLYMQQYEPCPVMLWVRPLGGDQTDDTMLVIHGQDEDPLPPEIIRLWIRKALRGEL